jgi:hypothetical protein
MRWLSPPDSVPELRARREIFEADIEQEGRRSRISLRMRTAISFCLLVQQLPAATRTSRRALRIDICEMSPICLLVDLHRQRFRLQPKPSQAGRAAADK